jgi:hypothetical protein
MICLRRAACKEPFPYWRDPSLVFCHGVERQMVGGTMPAFDTAVAAAGADWQIVSGTDFIRTLCAKGYNPVGGTTIIRRTGAQKEVGYYVPPICRGQSLSDTRCRSGNHWPTGRGKVAHPLCWDQEALCSPRKRSI